MPRRRSTDPVLTARANVGNAVQFGTPADVADARRDLAAAKLERHIQQVVAEAPPLTDEQRKRLAALLDYPGSA